MIQEAGHGVWPTARAGYGTAKFLCYHRIIAELLWWHVGERRGWLRRGLAPAKTFLPGKDGHCRGGFCGRAQRP